MSLPPLLLEAVRSFPSQICTLTIYGVRIQTVLGSWGKLGRESSDPAEAANRSLALSPADNLGCQLLGRYFELRIVLRPKEAQGMDFSSACPWPSDDLIRTMMP